MTIPHESGKLPRSCLYAPAVEKARPELGKDHRITIVCNIDVRYLHARIAVALSLSLREKRGEYEDFVEIKSKSRKL